MSTFTLNLNGILAQTFRCAKMLKSEVQFLTNKHEYFVCIELTLLRYVFIEFPIAKNEYVATSSLEISMLLSKLHLLI